MKIVILGAGALGSIATAHLARAGADVALIARGPRAKLLAEQGVRVEGIDSFTAKVQIVEQAQELEACDAFMLTAKTYDTAGALESVRGLKAEMAFSVQNGIAKDEELARVFGTEHTLGCIANFSGEVREDGSVLFSRNEGLYIGESPSGISARVQELASIIDGAGVRTIASENIESVEWSKFTGWLGVTAVSVLSRLYTHHVYQDTDLGKLQVTLIKEASRLAAKASVELVDLGGMLMPKTISSGPEEDGIGLAVKAGQALESNGMLTHRMSALQDLMRGRHLEVEETYGWAVRKGRELGVEMPALEACYRLLAAIDRHQG